MTSMTSTSLTIRWQDFPLNFPLQRFLVKYKEQNINLTMVFQVSKWNSTHNSGSVLKGYQFYEVQVIAVITASGNGTYMYSTKAALTRTSEGGNVYTVATNLSMGNQHHHLSVANCIFIALNVRPSGASILPISTL